MQAYLTCCLLISMYLTGSTPYYNAYFGRGSGPILLDDLLCTGSEARIIDCRRSTSQGVGTYDYCAGHADDAGVRCLERKPVSYTNVGKSKLYRKNKFIDQNRILF